MGHVPLLGPEGTFPVAVCHVAPLEESDGQLPEQAGVPGEVGWRTHAHAHTCAHTHAHAHLTVV